MKKLKFEINQIIEEMRNSKVIKSGLEVEINILADKKYNSVFDKINLNDFLVCSRANFKNNAETGMQNLVSLKDIKVLVKKASGEKCNHCWKISERPCERKSCQIK